MSYLAVVDAGASEIKACIFDSTGNEIVNVRRDCPVESPNPGWAQCPSDILMQWPVELLSEAIRSSGIGGDQIRAVAITGSTGTVLPIGADGTSTGPVILWYDSRARSAVPGLASRLSPDRFAQLTGVPMDHVSVVTKILWFRAEHPEAYASTAVFAHPQTAVLHAVTGSGWFCDDSHGPYFGLMDLEAKRWSDELLGATRLSLPSPIAYYLLVCPTCNREN